MDQFAGGGELQLVLDVETVDFDGLEVQFLSDVTRAFALANQPPTRLLSYFLTCAPFPRRFIIASTFEHVPLAPLANNPPQQNVLCRSRA